MELWNSSVGVELRVLTTPPLEVSCRQVEIMWGLRIMNEIWLYDYNYGVSLPCPSM
jgi:hypothetical protein